MEERGTKRDRPMKPQVVAWELGKRLSDTAIVSSDSEPSRRGLHDRSRPSEGNNFHFRVRSHPRLLETYALKLTGPPTTMDLGLLYRALEQQQVNMIAGNSTDDPISVFDVTVRRDDRQSFPAYEAAIVVRPESLDHVPGLSEALNELTGRLSEDTMRRLNHQAVTRQGKVADVPRVPGYSGYCPMK